MIKIPKRFHQIWIHPTNPELPDKYKQYRDTWLALHPDWSYQLWHLNNLDFTPRHASLLRTKTSAAQLADVLRYELLYQHGGVYIDTDFECRKNIEPLLVDVENFACSENGTAVSVGILGAVPKSPLMKRCLDCLPTEIGCESPTTETGPGFFTRALFTYGFHNELTLFPTGDFYPYGYDEPERANETFPNAYGIHRWAHSWKSDWEKSNTLARRIKRFLIRQLSD